MESLLSIIIPVYNTEKYLHRCLESVINQTYKNLEIIIVDDGSTDLSVSICKEIEKKDSRVTVISNCDKGTSSARNFGISKAEGEYITFVDSDDYLELDAYEKALKNIRDCDAIFFGYYEDYENLKYKKTFCPICTGEVGKYDAIYNCIFPYDNNYFTSVFNKVFKREKVKDLLFDKTVIVGEDEIWLVQATLRLSKIALYNEPLYYYVQRPNSTLRSIEKISRDWLSQVEAKEKVINILSNNEKCYEAVVPKEYGEMFALVVYSYIVYDYSKSQTVYKRINKYKKQYLLSKDYSFRRKTKLLLVDCLIKFKAPKKWIYKIWETTKLKIYLTIHNK